MGIQSSVNALMQQLYTIGAIGAGLREQRKQTKGQENIIKGQEAQTEAAKSLQEAFEKKKRDEFYSEMFDYDGKLTRHGEEEARLLQYRINRGIELDSENNEFYNNPAVQNYLKSQATNSKLKNKVASDLARGSVEARTASINQTKSNFDEHTASLIKYYSKGSGNP